MVPFSGQRWMLPAYALVPEQALENGLDAAGRSEDALEPRPPAAGLDDDEVAHGRLARSLAVDDDRNAALEVRLADEEPAPPGQLADKEVHAPGYSARTT